MGTNFEMEKYMAQEKPVVIAVNLCFVKRYACTYSGQKNNETCIYGYFFCKLYFLTIGGLQLYPTLTTNYYLNSSIPDAN